MNTFVFFILAGLMLFLSSLRMDSLTQGFISLTIISFLVLIRHFSHQGYWRILFLTFSCFIVLRYFFWRTLYSLEYQDLYSHIGALTLYAAEVYGGVMFFLSAFVNIKPLQRQFTPLPDDERLWPTVDVLIPSYNEPLDLVKITLAAASNIDYPSHKLNIYLLDDGATQEKLCSSDTNVRLTATQRQKDFQAACASLGINYLSRADNSLAKAGNMNAALASISGTLLLILDADHAPAIDILQKTVGSFIRDEKLFLVQTPHFFINPDPLEKNLNLFHRMPPENFMFYGAIQLGLDFWQSSFFCGSAAVLRRTAIDEMGGFKGKTITEDSETALLLHSRGWKSQYLLYPLISGLQPETFSSFMLQRIRWAQGMVQNFIFHNPIWLPNLKIWQRLCYLSNMLFWFFPFARLIFLISPGLYLIFGLRIYNANLIEFISFILPYLIVLMLTNHYLFSKVRWAFLSEIYEILQSLFSLRAVWAVIQNPHTPKFAVTPKQETLEQDFLSPLSKPFYWTIGFTFLQIFFGLWRFFEYPDKQAYVAITMFWALFNLLLLLSVLGVLFEHKQRRSNPRIPVKIQAELLINTEQDKQEQPLKITITDLSTSGGKLYVSQAFAGNLTDYRCRLHIFEHHLRGEAPLNIEIVNCSQEQNTLSYGIKFKIADMNDFRRVVRFVHGDSTRWVELQTLVGQDPGLIRSIFILAKTGIYFGFSHIKLAVKSHINQQKYA